MKKIIKTISIILSIVALCFSFGCNETDCEKGLHKYKENQIVLDEEDLIVYRERRCTECDKPIKSKLGYGAVSTKSAQNAINNLAKSGETVYLCPGSYASSINVTTNEEVTITTLPQTDFTISSIKIQTSASITIKGVRFNNTITTTEVGVMFAGGQNGVVIENCTFTGYARINNATHCTEVKNTTIKNCTFDIDEFESSCCIYFTSPNGLTVSGCSFKGSVRAALLVGEGGFIKGQFNIENNAFYSVGSRCVQFRKWDESFAMNVSGNTFFTHDNYLQVIRESGWGETPVILTVGVNSWQQIPSSINSAVYNPAEQIQL